MSVQRDPQNPRRQWCPKCGAPVRVGPDADDACPACGYTDPGGFSPTPIAGVSIELPELPLAGPLGKALGLPAGMVMLLHGGPGTGKTTLAMQGLPEAGVLSTEQDPGTVGAYRTRLGLPWTPSASFVLDDDGRPVDVRVDGELRRQVGLVVDSVSEAPCDPIAAIGLLVEWAAEHDQPVIAIAHEVKDGSAAGPQKVAHRVHAVVQLEEAPVGRIVRVKKRRSGMAGAVVPFRLEADTSPPRYFSIEGHGARLRLVEHPSNGAEFAAPLVMWERGELELPPPPLAVAARRSKLGKRGLLEPGDIEARRAFAAGFGLPLWNMEAE